MRGSSPAALALVSCLFSQVSAVYLPLREYAGDTFFDQWAYYGNVDNTTWGNVTYLDQVNATQQKLTFVNGAGNAVIQVDNTSTIVAGLPGEAVNRNSIRLTSLDSYGLGTLLIADILHLPYGCSVWPSLWTYGIEQEWPLGGEIDIIEAINGMDHNQIALHTIPGCMKQEGLAPDAQLGRTLQTNCSVPQGCIVAETKPHSFGPGFAQAGGGVYAVQMEPSGIYVWFWSRQDVPANIQAATSTSQMDVLNWGPPSAAYPSGDACNITQYFPPQNLVLLTTLCGDWAGVPSIYSSTCPGNCFADNILGNGSNFIDAYWEIRYIRTYISDAIAATGTTTTSAGPTVTTGNPTVTSTQTVTGSAIPPVAKPGSSAALDHRVPPFVLAIVALVTWFTFR